MSTETSERLSKALLEWQDWIHREIAKRSDKSEPQEVVNYNKHVVFGLKLALAAMKDAINSNL